MAMHRAGELPIYTRRCDRTQARILDNKNQGGLALSPWVPSTDGTHGNSADERVKNENGNLGITRKSQQRCPCRSRNTRGNRCGYLLSHVVAGCLKRLLASALLVILAKGSA